MSSKEALLRKIHTLALKGVDGEKQQAQSILDKLMKKYDISLEELDEEKICEYEFEYHGKEQKSLLRQTIYKVTGDKSAVWSLQYTDSGRQCKTRLGGRCTAAQKVEIDFLFDFYKRIWEKDKQALLSAFIQKHRIFGELKPGEKAREISAEKMEKMNLLMLGLSDESPQKQLPDMTIL